MKYFIVKTDQHIVEPGETLYGIDTIARAKACIEAMTKESVPIEAVIDLGDVADTIRNKNRDTAEASADSYALARSLFAPLPPVRLHIPGNHDAPELMYEILGDHWQQRRNGCATYDFFGTTIVGLDVRTGPEPTAHLSDETATALDSALKASARAVVMMHYPWITTEHRRIDDELRVTNHQRLEQLLLRHKAKVQAVFHGHLHLWCLNSFHGIPVFASSGTGFMFALEPGTMAREKPIPGPLGYYLVGIDEHGSLHVRPRFVLHA